MSTRKKLLSDFIYTLPGFQYSVNLKYDFENTEKISNYILTSGVVDTIEEILISTELTSKDKADRARLLIGPYGKGKSHLILLIAGMLYHSDRTVFENVLDKVKVLKPELYDLAVRAIEAKEKFLPVIIGGNSLDLTQSFMVSLKDALVSAGLSDILPNTYFTAAVDMINLWDSEYPDTFKKFSSKIGIPVEEFKHELNQYNNYRYTKFVELYPELTSGSEFNPLKGIDIADLYFDIAKKISSKGYKGIFVIYDEFSKFLEGSIERYSALEIKQLQDFAEMCNRSGNTQVHILLISHKSILSYVDRLPKERVNSWKAVGERFKTVEIKNMPSQLYEIIAHVIKKEKSAWDTFYNQNIEYIDSLTVSASRSGLFSEVDKEIESEIINGCYPLHPASVYVLPRISEKVAQNERTLFTFLSKNEMNTLGYFLLHNSTGFPLLTPDIIYDYFEGLIKKENYNSDIYNIWRKAVNTLNKLSDDEVIAQKIVKTIALIYIVNEFNKLLPNKENISFALSCGGIEQKQVRAVLEDLIKRKIIYYYSGKDVVDFIETSGLPVEEKILDAIEKRKQAYNSKSVINECLGESYMYPARYNDEFEITRYFDLEFIAFKELDTKNWSKKIEDRVSDGTIFAVLLDNSEQYSIAVKLIEKIKYNRVVFALVNKVMDISMLLLRFDGIRYLIEKNQVEGKDRLFHEELTVYLDDVKEQILNYLNAYTRPELGLCEYYYEGERKYINRRALLNKLLSKICEKIYNNTPVIINEMINKSQPSSIAIQSRRKVLDGLLKNRLEHRLGLIGYGQDVSIMQSTLIVLGILRDDDCKTYICTEGLSANLGEVLRIIKDFFIRTSQEGRKSFGVLYDNLMNPKYGIGMRKGLIPIYIAVVLHELKRYTVVLRNGYESEIIGSLLDRINDSPDDYEVQIEEWNAEKEEYISALEKIFKDFIIDSEREYNTFEYIAKAIQRWFLQLPRYTKEFTLKDGESGDIKLRTALKSTMNNPRDLLFEKVFKMYGYKEFSPNIVKKIENLKKCLDSSISKLMEDLAEDIKKLFQTDSKTLASFGSIIKDWYEGLSELTKKNLFKSGEDRVLGLIENISNNHEDFIKKLSRELIGLRIEDWNDETYAIFIGKVSQFKSTVDEFEQKLRNSGDEAVKGNSYRIIYSNANGEDVEKSIERIELEGRAQTAYNDILNIITNEYGDSLDLNEKRQILLKIFEKLC